MLLGIDSGQTALKAVVINEDGSLLGSASRPTQRLSRHPHWVERDMEHAWQQCAEVIRAAMESARIDGSQITALSLVGHGDGVYPIDSGGAPTRQAILALDSRAAPILAEWETSGVLDAARGFTGQEPHAGSLAPLSDWLRTHEPDAFGRTRWLLNCKDFLRLRLTGEVATDIVEANSCFGLLDGSGYSDQAFQAYGLPEVRALVPDAHSPLEVGGQVTAVAAELTGLRAGTPVIIGTHDIVGAAIGVGASKPGQYSLMAGTYSISQVFAHGRVVDRRWQARPWVGPDEWVYMAASPASATNLEWFLRTLAQGERDPIGLANREAAAVLGEASPVQFHPFLFGSPYGPGASATFLGMHGWHTRGHLFRALFEGVAFNHLMQVRDLGSVSPASTFRFTGGGAKSPLWCQMFADALNAPIQTTEHDETGALGAALCAGVGTGVFPTLAAAETACVRVKAVFEPTADGADRMADGFRRYQRSVAHLRSLWPCIEDVSSPTAYLDSALAVDGSSPGDSPMGSTATQEGSSSC